MGMALDEAEKDDKQLKIDGIDILLSERDRQYVGEFQIDYINDFRGKGLVIHSAGAC